MPRGNRHVKDVTELNAKSKPTIDSVNKLKQFIGVVIGVVENTSDSTNNQNKAKSSDSLQRENT